MPCVETRSPDSTRSPYRPFIHATDRRLAPSPPKPPCVLPPAIPNYSSPAPVVVYSPLAMSVPFYRACGRGRARGGGGPQRARGAAPGIGRGRGSTSQFQWTPPSLDLSTILLPTVMTPHERVHANLAAFTPEQRAIFDKPLDVRHHKVVTPSVEKAHTRLRRYYQDFLNHDLGQGTLLLEKGSVQPSAGLIFAVFICPAALLTPPLPPAILKAFARYVAMSIHPTDGQTKPRASTIHSSLASFIAVVDRDTGAAIPKDDRMQLRTYLSSPEFLNLNLVSESIG